MQTRKKDRHKTVTSLHGQRHGRRKQRRGTQRPRRVDRDRRLDGEEGTAPAQAPRMVETWSRMLKGRDGEDGRGRDTQTVRMRAGAETARTRAGAEMARTRWETAETVTRRNSQRHGRRGG
jgi:hypothetical protein